MSVAGAIAARRPMAPLGPAGAAGPPVGATVHWAIPGPSPPTGPTGATVRRVLPGPPSTGLSGTAASRSCRGHRPPAPAGATAHRALPEPSLLTGPAGGTVRRVLPGLPPTRPDGTTAHRALLGRRPPSAARWPLPGPPPTGLSRNHRHSPALPGSLSAGSSRGYRPPGLTESPPTGPTGATVRRAPQRPPPTALARTASPRTTTPRTTPSPPPAPSSPQLPQRLPRAGLEHSGDLVGRRWLGRGGAGGVARPCDLVGHPAVADAEDHV